MCVLLGPSGEGDQPPEGGWGWCSITGWTGGSFYNLTAGKTIHIVGMWVCVVPVLDTFKAREV